MRGYYLKPVKQDLYTDWKRFAQSNLFPHTQTCPNCSMIIELTRLHNLDNDHNRRLWATHAPGWSAEKKANHPKVLGVQCPGCGVYFRFTGAEHLPKQIQSDILKKVEKELRNFDGSLTTKQDYIPLYIGIGIILLVLLVTAVVT